MVIHHGYLLLCRRNITLIFEVPRVEVVLYVYALIVIVVPQINIYYQHISIFSW